MRALAEGPALVPCSLCPPSSPAPLSAPPLHPRRGRSQGPVTAQKLTRSAHPAWTQAVTAQSVTPGISDSFSEITLCLKHDFIAPAALHCPNVLGQPLSLWTVSPFLQAGNPPSCAKLTQALAGRPHSIALVSQRNAAPLLTRKTAPPCRPAGRADAEFPGQKR